jgi:hypothetical protein
MLTVDVVLRALQVEVHRLVWFVGILALSVAIILFVVGVARKLSLLPAFVNGFILVVVANVPEVRALTELHNLCVLAQPATGTCGHSCIGLISVVPFGGLHVSHWQALDGLHVSLRCLAVYAGIACHCDLTAKLDRAALA